MVDRYRLAGEHRLVDGARPFQYHAVGRDLLARSDDHHVARHQGRHSHGALPALDQDAGLLGAELGQALESGRGPALGPRLQGAAQGDEGDDHRRRLEEGHRLGEHGPDRVAVRHQRSHRDQGVHGGGTCSQLLESRAMELPAGPEDHGSRQHPLHDGVPQGMGTGHRQHHQGGRKRRRQPEAAPLDTGLGVEGVREAAPLPVVGAQGQLVPDGAHRLGQGGGVGTVAGPHRRRAAGQVDRGGVNPLLTAQHPFDAAGARGAGHPVDLEGEDVVRPGEVGHFTADREPRIPPPRWRP